MNRFRFLIDKDIIIRRNTLSPRIIPPIQALSITLLTDFVEVKRIFSRYGTVKSSLQVRGPVVVEYIFATSVFLAHPGHAGKYALATVDILDGGLAEEEEHVLADVIGAHEVWF